jgi:hypothetical protein
VKKSAKNFKQKIWEKTLKEEIRESQIGHSALNWRALNSHTSATAIISDTTIGGFIKGILRGVRCTKSLRVLFLHRRPPSRTTLVLYSKVVFIFNEPAYCFANARQCGPWPASPWTRRLPTAGTQRSYSHRCATTAAS